MGFLEYVISKFDTVEYYIMIILLGSQHEEIIFLYHTHLIS